MFLKPRVVQPWVLRVWRREGISGDWHGGHIRSLDLRQSRKVIPVRAPKHHIGVAQVRGRGDPSSGAGGEAAGEVHSPSKRALAFHHYCARGGGGLRSTIAGTASIGPGGCARRKERRPRGRATVTESARSSGGA